MKGRKKIALLSVAVLLILTACNLSPIEQQVVENSSIGLVETSVVQTLSAMDSVEDKQPENDVPDQVPSEPDMPEDESIILPELRVAYVDDGDLWLWTENGGNIQLYTGETVDRVIISPDAELVAFTTLGQDFRISGLWKIQIDGTGLSQLVSQADFVAMTTEQMALGTVPFHWEFVPNSHILAFNTRLVFEGPGLVIQDEIFHLDPDTGVLSSFFSSGNQNTNFNYSPDGSRIAFMDPSSVNLLDADGSNRRDDILTFPFVNTASEFSFVPAAHWLPDSSEFWVIIPGVEPFGPDASFEVFRISSDGNGVSTFIPPTDSFGPSATFEVFALESDGNSVSSIGTYPGAAAHLNAEKMIAPNGSAIAYFQHTGNGQDLYLGVIGGPDIPYDEDVNDLKGWSQDSAYFIYGTIDGNTMVGQVGSEPQILEPSFVFGDVIWLEDGRVLYAVGTTESTSLRLGMPGSESVLIASTGGNFLIFDAVP